MKKTCIAFLLFVYFSGFSQDIPSVYATLQNHYDNGEFELCTGMEAQVLSFIDGRHDTLASNSLSYLASAWFQLGDIARALTHFEREKTILESIGMSNTEAHDNALYNLAYLHLLNGNYTEAGKHVDALLITYANRFPADHDDFVTCVLYAADVFMQLDRLNDAEKLITTTLRQQARHSLNRSRLLNKLGDLYNYRGQYSRASRALGEALEIAAKVAGEESPEYINAAVNTGILYMNQGKYPEAEEVFDFALEKVDQEDIAYASLQNNQALVYQSLGQFERAESTLRAIAATDSIQLGTDHPDFAITLSNLALVCADRGKYGEAKALVTRALSILASNGETNSLTQASLLNNLAKIHQGAGEPALAVPMLERASGIFKSQLGKRSADYATSLHNLGVAIWQNGSADAGYKYLKTAADIRRRVLGKNHPRYAETMLKLAEYQWHKKSIRNARESFGEVFRNYYFQIDETFPVLTEEEKTKFYYNNIREAFDKFNAMATAVNPSQPGLIDDVFNYTINTKGAIMLATEKVRTSILASGDSSLIALFEQWQASREQIAKRYNSDEGDTALDSLLTYASALEKELNRRSATFAQHLSRKRYHRSQVQEALNEGDAVVEVVRFRHYTPEAGGRFTGEIHYAFLIITANTGAGPHLILLKNGTDLEGKHLRYYRNAIQYQLEDRNSYHQFLEPLARYLRDAKIRRVFLSPDGVYNQISINSLVNPETGKFIVDEFDIRLVTSSRELVEKGQDKRNDQSSILIGFPTYHLGDAELSRTATAGHLRGTGNRAWRGGLMRYMRGEDGITPLPGTATEVRKIADLVGENAKIYMEGEASERVTKSVRNPGTLHIATHGYFLEDVAPGRESEYIASPLMNAGLMLAGAENFLRTGYPLNEEGDDGILTAFEAMNLSLEGTQLVVLSACETALGDVRNGEGVYGLQRAFKVAGAKSIVMSLWSVDDAATQELMTAFYSAMTKTTDQHEAFRIAQRTVKEKYPAPFYWAAFVMVGL